MKYKVKVGTDYVIQSNGGVFTATVSGAKRYGNKHMPDHLKRAGFECIASVIPTWISLKDEEYIRINYCKKC